MKFTAVTTGEAGLLKGGDTNSGPEGLAMRYVCGGSKRCGLVVRWWRRDRQRRRLVILESVAGVVGSVSSNLIWA